MKLTEQQETAVTSQPKPVTPIIAGPGAGKTEVLVCRAIVECEREGTDGVAICAFTRSAAAELERRIEASNVCVPFVGTVHGLALDILKRNQLYAKHAILDEMTATLTLERIASEQGSKVVTLSKRHIPGATQEIAGFVPRTFSLLPEWTLALRYCTELLSAGYMDYDMLLALATGCLDAGLEHPFKVVLVDEFQDISEIEATFISSLRCRLVAVGDPNQAIFGFKGGDATVFNDMCIAFKPHVLNNSFRCPPAVCEVANRLVGDNQEIYSACEHAGEVEFYSSQTVSECEEALVRLVAKNPVSTAILCRYNEEVEYVMSHLEYAGIKCCGRAKLIEERAITTFTFLVDTENEFAAFAYVSERFGKAFAVRESATAKAMGVSLNKHLGLIAQTLTPYEAIRWMKSISGGRHDLFGLESVQQIEAIVNDERSVGLLGPEIAALLAGSQPHKPNMSSVNVLTIHSAKGLEFQNVVVAQFMKQSSAKRDSYNLLYVAFTRASRKLVVLCNGKPAGPLALESFQTRFVPAKQALPIAD